MRLVSLSILAALGLAGCQKGELAPESRCSMYWDYYYNTGVGKPPATRQQAEGVKFDDVRSIVRNDPSSKTRVCQKILNDAFPGDPALKDVKDPIPAVTAG
ncbi:MAG: hypothetical protein EOP61_01895 [Sphingomonadales bacterium]|nr:MAG: hypothetical protein EOP61_01895 [Sphingomonadales bacterium]